LLCPVPRAEGRRVLGIGEVLPFHGVDVWTHYEVSWLDAQGKPQVAVADIRVPAASPCIIESKSMKLYFNSLNFEHFDDEAALRVRLVADLSQAAGAAVDVRLFRPGAAQALAVTELAGTCIDDLPLAVSAFRVDAGLLEADAGQCVEETLHSHLLRSLCPVTHQPDWASVSIHYRGPAIAHQRLLAYIVSFRDHPDFHEQCVERMFCDISARCRPEVLTVYARYTRRGGIDINPWRSNLPAAGPDVGRLFRQ
ncbi:MAG: NADPH-dependent 7-cyano-7-deazaguanine reductase QueF, partial [Moraxellaceae bacterium]